MILKNSYKSRGIFIANDETSIGGDAIKRWHFSSHNDEALILFGIDLKIEVNKLLQTNRAFIEKMTDTHSLKNDSVDTFDKQTVHLWGTSMSNKTDTEWMDGRDSDDKRDAEQK